MISEREFESLFNRYFDELRRFVYFKCSDTDLATDIAQDVFTKIWEKRENFDERNIKALLYKMASDNLNTYFRRQKIKQESRTSIELDMDTPQQQMELNELKAQYEMAMAQLPEKQRVVFLMNRMEQLTYNEIAERLEISVKAIEKRMSKAINYLKIHLKR